MRQGQFSSWLTDWADQNCKTIQASYLDSLKSMIESKSDKKFATIQDALESFCTRLSLPVPDMKQVTASFVGGEEFNAVMAALGIKAFNTEDIDKLIGQGTPAEAIANEFGNTDQEKQAITEYVDSKAEKQRDESSQIARDMKLSDDLVKTTTSPGSQAVPKMSSIRSLSTKVAQTDPLKNAVQYMLLEREKGSVGPETTGIVAQHYGVTEEDLNNALALRDQAFVNTFTKEEGDKDYSVFCDGAYDGTYPAKSEEEAIKQWEENTLLSRNDHNIEVKG